MSITKAFIPLVKEIEDETFLNCNSLVNESMLFVEKIGKFAFFGCFSLSSVEIPLSMKEIGSFAFCGCDTLLSIKIPSSIKAIENYAFFECS